MIANSLAFASPGVPPVSQDTPVRMHPAAHLLDTIERGVIFVNDDGVVTYINKYAAIMMYVWQDSVTGKRVDMLPLNTPLYKLLSETCHGAPMDMVVNDRVIAARSVPVSFGGGMSGDMIELWDVTEDKRAKRQMEEFVTMMTHDLRSPLSIIMGYIQGMKCGMFGEISSRVSSVVDRAEESGKRLNAMIEEMLDCFRLEVGILNLNRQQCDVGRLLDGCYRDNLRVAQGQGVDLHLEVSDPLPDLHADSRQLTRVINNLVGNAIKYTPASGEVTVTAAATKEVLRLSVADTGIGIPPEDLSRVFLKYYRSAGATGIKGAGLGLAISKVIVEAHGGSIEVESLVGMGSTFTVTIPLVSPDEAAMAV